ncbi:MAG: ATP-binding protein [Armatimonadota bacterium]|nr:ATP-binding protein [Armatimonadota bacterium]
MAPSEFVRLEIPSSPKYLSLIRNLIDLIPTNQISLTEEQKDDIKLAIGEACSNAIKFSRSPNSPITIAFEIHPNQIEIEVRNESADFQPETLKIEPPPIEKIHEGGLGLYLIKQVMDNLKICCSNGITTVRMAKKLT